MFDLKDCTRILNSAQTSGDDFDSHFAFWQAVYNITEKYAQRLLGIAFALGELYVWKMKEIFKRIIRALLTVLGQLYNDWTEAQKKAFDAVSNNLWGI